MKEIFSYELPYKTKEKVTKVQEDGSELSSMQDIEKKIKVIIKQPTRKEVESAKNTYQEAWSDAVRRGILTRAIIDKTYSNQDGILSESDKKELQKASDQINKVRLEYEKFKDIKEEDKTDKQKKEIEKLLEKFTEAKNKFNQLEQLSESLYRNSAENIAQEKQLLYNTLFLSYIEQDGKVRPISEGETVEDRLSKLDSILDDDSSEQSKELSKFYDTVIKRNGYYIGQLSIGNIEISQLPILNEMIDTGKIVL